MKDKPSGAGLDKVGVEELSAWVLSASLDGTIDKIILVGSLSEDVK